MAEPEATVASPLQPMNGLRIPDISCLVATTPRSGSWLMSTAMQDSGLLGTPEEFFRPDARALWCKQWGIPVRAPYGVYVRRALDYSTGDNGVFSAKLHGYQMQWFLERLRPLRKSRWAHLPEGELLAKWLPNPHFVYLHRRDSARQALSFYRAARSGSWFVPTDEPKRFAAYNAEPTDEDWAYVRHLEDFVIAHNEYWLELFEVNQIMPLEVAYEDFVADFVGTLGRVLEYVGAGSASDVASLQPRLVRQADDVTDEWLARYRERRDAVEPMALPQELRPPMLGPDTEA